MAVFDGDRSSRLPVTTGTWKVNKTIVHDAIVKSYNVNTKLNQKKKGEPKLADVLKKVDRAKIINMYKTYLRKNLNNRWIKINLIELLYKLDNNNNIQKVYDTLGFVDEMQELEEQFYSLNKDLDFKPFYESLLKRITEYAKTSIESRGSSL